MTVVKMSAKSTRKARGRPAAGRCAREVLNRCAPADQNTGRALGATSPIVVDQGWLYDVLRWAGVSQPTAAHWQQVVIKPVTCPGRHLVAPSLIGWLGSRIIRRWVGAAAHKAVARADSPRAAARALTLTSLLANVWRGVVGAIAFFVVLGTIGLNLTPLLAGATVIGATLGFGAQSMVRDLLAGVLLTVEGQFDIGDTIMVGDTSGTVEDLTLRVTRLRSDDGTVWYVPNGEIRKLANSSRGWAQATVDVPVPVAAAVDTVLEAIQAAADAVSEDPRYAPHVPRAAPAVGRGRHRGGHLHVPGVGADLHRRPRARGPHLAPGDRRAPAGGQGFSPSRRCGGGSGSDGAAPRSRSPTTASMMLGHGG